MLAFYICLGWGGEPLILCLGMLCHTAQCKIIADFESEVFLWCKALTQISQSLAAQFPSKFQCILSSESLLAQQGA